jgi:hypothetical protein
MARARRNGNPHPSYTGVTLVHPTKHDIPVLHREGEPDDVAIRRVRLRHPEYNPRGG